MKDVIYCTCADGSTYCHGECERLIDGNCEVNHPCYKGSLWQRGETYIFKIEDREQKITIGLKDWRDG